MSADHDNSPDGGGGGGVAPGAGQWTFSVPQAITKMKNIAAMKIRNIRFSC